VQRLSAREFVAMIAQNCVISQHSVTAKKKNFFIYRDITLPNKLLQHLISSVKMDKRDGKE
jgi:hypothetical protein